MLSRPACADEVKIVPPRERERERGREREEERERDNCVPSIDRIAFGW